MALPPFVGCMNGKAWPMTGAASMMPKRGAWTSRICAAAQMGRNPFASSRMRTMAPVFLPASLNALKTPGLWSLAASLMSIPLNSLGISWAYRMLPDK